MSMIGNILRVTKVELEEYLKDSSLLESRIYPDEPATDDPQLADIDKAWDGIIFLLTGQNMATADHPLVKVLFSGQLIDENQDLGYGPANYLTPEQVADINHQIANITRDDLKARFDPEKMTESAVYPAIWDEGETAFEYLADGFSTLQNVYAAATKNGEAIITFLS